MKFLKNIARIAKALEVRNELEYWKCVNMIHDYTALPAVKLKRIRALMDGKNPNAAEQNDKIYVNTNNFTRV